MKLNKLTGNQLKIIAAVAMLIDHIGVLLFPDVAFLRIIGRLAFPIFAFMISEGARYTKSKPRYLLTIFVLASLCQAAYIVSGGFEPFNILITFSISIAIIFALNNFKSKLFEKERSVLRSSISLAVLLSLVTLAYIATRLVLIDYGFAGCLAPVAASLLDFRGIEAPEKLKKLDNIPLRAICLFVPIYFVMLRNMRAGDYFVSPFLFAALPLLLLYSGKRGTAKLKYFFYIFYPLHLVILEGIYMLVFVL